ncbi:unnamed protein product [Cuscuta campestris]|uniref:Uncharacterized protein n=1 Tax=Cuscuta campestris TaxID=132261 RepID=A0A484MJ64_9ASTE|nr:unnamed protein product [Cuscuta campestris]
MLHSCCIDKTNTGCTQRRSIEKAQRAERSIPTPQHQREHLTSSHWSINISPPHMPKPPQYRISQLIFQRCHAYQTLDNLVQNPILPHVPTNPS